jgi:GT2 family glycosyltransferase
MIYFFVPYSFEGNLGKAYNDYMRLLPNDDDWGVVMDGDTMFLTPDWGTHIKELIEEHPDAGCITCITNRIANKNQRIAMPSTNILEHRKRAMALLRERRNYVIKTKRHISGLLMAVKKSTWKEIPFPELGTILNVDNVWSKKLIRAGKEILIAKGLYILHYYRWSEGRASTSHIDTRKTKRKKAIIKKVRNRRATRAQSRNKV